jgi:hypothetical protein
VLDENSRRCDAMEARNKVFYQMYTSVYHMLIRCTHKKLDPNLAAYLLGRHLGRSFENVIIKDRDTFPAIGRWGMGGRERKEMDE